MQFHDQLNRTISLAQPPKRIISLVPSQTELLVDLGLEDQLVGITKFCVHPTHLREKKTIIGGTKNYRFEEIDKLKPDLIIGNKEENDQEGIEMLAKKYPVWISDIKTIQDVLSMIACLGEITHTQTKAEMLNEEISKDWEQSEIPKLGKAVYLIWNNPMMAVGTDTFIDHMLLKAGFENLLQESRYPELSLEELKKLGPDYLFLSSEPFPFKSNHLTFYQEHLPNSKVMKVDGEMFSWYGTRLLRSKKYIQDLISSLK